MSADPDRTVGGDGGSIPRVHQDLRGWALCLSGVRLELLLVLASGPARVGDLADQLELDYSSISRGLGQLRRHRCVTSVRDGPARVYSLSSIVRIKAVDAAVEIHLTLPNDRCLLLTLPRPV